MGIKVDKNRTDSYIGTFHYECADDMIQLDDVRAIVKNMNKSLRAAGMDYQFYVKCQGRGKNRFQKVNDYNIRKYGRTFGVGRTRYSAQASLPLECADYVDAYIYRRR